MSDIPVSLDHCVIHVSDWEAARDFYTRVMGAEAIEAPGGGYMFRFGTQQLNCHGPDKFAEPKARIPVEPGNSDLCFAWNGPIEDAVSHLDRENVAVRVGSWSNALRRAGRGQSSVYFRDPDGSLMEIHVLWRLTATISTLSVPTSRFSS